MATLVLTIAGGVIGGPIGAAIGGLIGNAVDHEIFRPKGREGPRLTELAVQTSSYGTPIPRVFGTMRVAGSVIWATDLIESKSTDGGGKGQPSTTRYSYSASFAVALSGRRIEGVGRIWADGKFLRGAEGDWKTMTGFRLYLGSEEQAADPLIASLEGDGLAPAHRGVAYAVFEELQLADFGNRIPSLTFEVIADTAPVAIGAMAKELAAGAIVGDGPAATLQGFSAYGDSARAVVALLGSAAGAWFAPVGDGLEMRSEPGLLATIEDAGFGREGKRRVRTIRAIETVPRDLTVAHYDPARDYQTGVQHARRPGAGYRVEHVDLPAVIDAATARTIAEAMLARAETERTRRTVTLDIGAIGGAIGIAPGDGVTIAGEGGVWRAASVSIEAMAVAIDLVPVTPPILPAIATPGRALGAPDVQIGETILAAFETPALDDALLTQPRLTIAAAGTGAGWRRAALLYSLDDGASWIAAGATAAPAVIGVVTAPPRPGSSTLRDLANVIEVELSHEGMTLQSAAAAAIDRGANLALVGGELLQFADAAQVGPTLWRLSGLLRGRRGMSATHVAGERFVLIARDTAVSIALPPAIVRKTVRVMASGVGDVAGPASASAAVSGLSIAPPSPVHLTLDPLSDGSARLRWVRRSRIGWSWTDGIDVPLGEEREAYRVTITVPGAVDRRAIVTMPEMIVAESERVSGAIATVRQLGTSGDSPDATIALV